MPVPSGTFDEAVRFYEDGLGWRRIRELDRPGRRVVFVSDGRGFALELTESDGRALVDPLHLAVTVSLAGLDDAVERLRAFGCDIGELTRRDGEGDGGPFSYVFLADPAGNRIQLVARSTPMSTRFAETDS